MYNAILGNLLKSAKMKMLPVYVIYLTIYKRNSLATGQENIFFFAMILIFGFFPIFESIHYMDSLI